MYSICVLDSNESGEWTVINISSDIGHKGIYRIYIQKLNNDIKEKKQGNTPS